MATVGSSASGRVSFSLQVTDRAGNLGDLITQTTDQSLVELDTPPEIQNLTLVSDNSEDTLIQAREDDNITLQFDSLEKLQVPQITLSGHPLEVVDISSGAGTSGKRSIRSSLEIREKSASPSITKTRLPTKASKKLVMI